MRTYICSFLLISLLVISHFAFCQSSNSINDQLFEASRVGDAEKIKKLLEEGIDINSEDKHGGTALSYAVERNHIELTELLISSGADVNHRSENVENTALMAAPCTNSTESLQLLLNKGAEVNAKNARGETALLLASACRNIPVIKLLLNHGANVNDADQRGNSALMNCLSFQLPQYGDLLGATSVLLTAGADVNQPGEYGWTPARAAFIMRNLDVLRLIAPKVQGKFWKNAAEDFKNAVDNPELVQLYLDAGADVNAGHELGWNLLIEAARKGSTRSIQLLIKSGADVNSTDSNGASPIQVAVSRRDAEMVRVLISEGAKIEDVKNDFLKSALLAGDSDTGKVLKDAGAYVENQKELTLKGQISKFLETGHRIEAEEVFRTLEKEFPDADRKAEIFRLGDLYLREALYNESINLHQQVIQNYPGSSTIPFAYYQIAQAYKKLGLESDMAKALEDSLSYSVTKEDSIEFDVPGLYGDAHEELARYYMKIGNWSRALNLWEQWQPFNDCLGTAHDEKNRMIIECKAHLQQQQ